MLESHDHMSTIDNNTMTRSPDHSDFGKVAVLMGGRSAERDISLQSGQAVLDALQRSGIDAYEFDTARQELTQLLSESFDRAFIALHGRGGEDGQIQGALEALGIPYTGSGVLASALGMDKYRSKRLWQSHALPTPDFMLLDKDSDIHAVVEQIGLPMMIKPAREGSSIGISKVNTIDELPEAIEQAMALDDSVLAEAWVNGKEYTVPILNEQILPMIRLETPREFYDYVAKYEVDTTSYICPCGLDQEEESRIGLIAREAFQVIDGRGWGRVDLMIDEKSGPMLIEVNTVPGLTSHSLVPMSARVAGIDFDQLIVEILRGSLNHEC